MIRLSRISRTLRPIFRHPSRFAYVRNTFTTSAEVEVDELENSFVPFSFAQRTDVPPEADDLASEYIHALKQVFILLSKHNSLREYVKPDMLLTSAIYRKSINMIVEKIEQRNLSEIFPLRSDLENFIQVTESDLIEFGKKYEGKLQTSSENRAKVLGTNSKFIAKRFDNLFELNFSDCSQFSEIDPLVDRLFARSREYIARVVEENFAEEIAELSTIAEFANLSNLHTQFPLARSMKRKIVYHAGPTNSGKTYNAIQRLKQSHSGVYCGPLRLLALEIFDDFNSSGTPCNLYTGQDKKTYPFARHTACTVEILNPSKFVDVVVIDEIQLIGDPDRGHAWTRAVLAAPAPEIHLCGDISSLEVVKSLCELTGDSFELVEYSRLTPLRTMDEPLGSLAAVRKGDVVVAFSRSEIFRLRREIEESTGLPVAVVYGSLPSSTRAAQGALFNDPEGGCDVLVASDAIGLGLNLNIRRVIFSSLEKFNGLDIVPVGHSLVKQIAGRAGRRNSVYGEGFASAVSLKDLEEMKRCLQKPMEPLTRARAFPEPNQLIDFAMRMRPGARLLDVVSTFMELANLGRLFEASRIKNLEKIGDLVDSLPLGLASKFLILLAPVSISSPIMAEINEHYLEAMRGRVVYCGVQLTSIAKILNAPTQNHSLKDGGNSVGTTQLQIAPESRLDIDDLSVTQLTQLIESLEVKAATLDLYQWYADHVGSRTSIEFPDAPNIAVMKHEIVETLNEALNALTILTMKSRVRSKLKKTFNQKQIELSLRKDGTYGRKVRKNSVDADENKNAFRKVINDVESSVHFEEADNDSTTYLAKIPNDGYDLQEPVNVSWKIEERILNDEFDKELSKLFKQ